MISIRLHRGFRGGDGLFEHMIIADMVREQQHEAGIQRRRVFRGEAAPRLDQLAKRSVGSAKRFSVMRSAIMPPPPPCPGTAQGGPDAPLLRAQKARCDMSIRPDEIGPTTREPEPLRHSFIRHENSHARRCKACRRVIRRKQGEIAPEILTEKTLAIRRIGDGRARCGAMRPFSSSAVESTLSA